MRLLPRNPSIGWTPFAWLIYLPIFLADPLSRHTSRAEWVVTFAGMAVFLALYFIGYWVSGFRLLLVIAGLFCLASGFAPWNFNSGVFIVYAASFAAKLAPPRRAIRILVGMTVATAIESWVLRLPAWYWGPGLLMAWVIGGVNIHFWEVGRASARLRESQEQAQQLARIAERERIARDLHDLLGHTLSVIALKAELAGKLLASSPERAAAEIRDVQSVTRDALREVRSAVAGYRSEGLPAELARARLALDVAGVRAEYFVLPVELPAAAEAALSLALREAVTNVIRHAGASVCRVTLDRLPGATLLQVADDGRGGARERPTGSGLRAMRERLAGLGGTLEIGEIGEIGAPDPSNPSNPSDAHAGTCLTVTLPHSAAPAATPANAGEAAALAVPATSAAVVAPEAIAAIPARRAWRSAGGGVVPVRMPLGSLPEHFDPADRADCADHAARGRGGRRRLLPEPGR